MNNMSDFNNLEIREKQKQPKRLGQRGIYPTRVRKRLLGAGASAAHALNDTDIHTGEISDAQHGARTIASAHRLEDISPRNHSTLGSIGEDDHHARQHAISSASDHTGSITDAQHGTVTQANAHAFSHISSTIASSQIPAAHKRRFSHHVKEADDSAAGDATAEIPVFQAQDAVTITGAFYLPASTLTANDTDYATLLCYRRDSSGGSQATIASVATTTGGSGNWTAFDGVSLGTLSNTAIASGEMVTFEITKAASGVVVPRGSFQIEYTTD